MIGSEIYPLVEFGVLVMLASPRWPFCKSHVWWRRQGWQV